MANQTRDRKSKYRNNNKGRNTRNDTKARPKDAETDAKSGGTKANDPSWYTINGQLTKDVASFSFNNALGAPLNIGTSGSLDNNEVTSAYFNVPGIMVINTMPGVGYSVDGSSPINIAAKNIYSFVRHQNSGHANYDSPDLMLYLMAVDSAIIFWAHMVRLYGVTRLFSQTNRYMGDAMIKACGGNPTSLRSDLADFRAFINIFATKLSAFAVPKSMSVYARHTWMYTSIFTDAQITKAQSYVYVPRILFKYVETEGAGRLDPIDTRNISAATPINTTMIQNSLTNYVEVGNTILDALTGSEDINIMSGDILKAYGKENLWSLTMIPDDYVTMPFYSAEVLSQIHNTRFAGNQPRGLISGNTAPAANWNSLKIEQSTGVDEGGNILFRPVFKNKFGLDFDPLIDMFMEEPTPEDILVATRNTILGASKLISNDHYTELKSFATDIPLWASIIIKPNGNKEDIFLNDEVEQPAMSNAYYKFNGAPLAYVIGTTTNNQYCVTDVMGDISNYTVMSFDDLNKIHESALLSMFAVPLLGVSTK